MALIWEPKRCGRRIKTGRKRGGENEREEIQWRLIRILIPQLSASGCRLWSGDSVTAPLILRPGHVPRLPRFYLLAQRGEEAAHQTGSPWELITEAKRWCGRGIRKRVRVYIYLYEFPDRRSTTDYVDSMAHDGVTVVSLRSDDRVIFFQASFRLLVWVNFIQMEADQMWGSSAAFSIKEPCGVTQEVWKVDVRRNAWR